MRQFLLVLWMLVSLVACPFDCMGRMTSGSSPEISHGCCCSHCDTESREPGVPASEGERCDCICRGAVLTDSVSFSVAGRRSTGNRCSELFFKTWSDAVIDVARAEESSFDAARRECLSASVRWRPGRIVRLAMHSLQI